MRQVSLGITLHNKLPVEIEFEVYLLKHHCLSLSRFLLDFFSLEQKFFFYFDSFIGMSDFKYVGKIIIIFKKDDLLNYTNVVIPLRPFI